MRFMDKKTDKGIIHVGVGATSGEDYWDITINNLQNNISRRIVIDNGFVISDYISVFHGIEKGRINETYYYALDVDTNSESKVPLFLYIMNPFPFDLKGDTLEGEIPDISILLEFFNANNNLRDFITPEPGVIL